MLYTDMPSSQCTLVPVSEDYVFHVPSLTASSKVVQQSNSAAHAPQSMAHTKLSIHLVYI